MSIDGEKIAQSREKFLDCYSQKIINLATAIGALKKIENSLEGKKPDSSSARIMEDMQKIIKKASDEERKAAEDLIKARDDL